ncbi:MAG: MFS transporter [Chloroflexi bacterium]|nr:MFS transporter [Chloroflexota bacterium]
MDNERKTQITMLAFACDYIAWGVGMTFINPTTVMPTFVRHFTDEPGIIGLINTIQMGGFLIPQLIISNLIAHRVRKKPIMMYSGFIHRGLPWLFALFLMLNPNAPGPLILIVFYAGYTLFNIGDSISTVPWFDIMGKSVPADRRGRMMGTAQIIASLLGIGAGQVVKLILSPEGPAFPLSYALCFAIAGCGIVLSWISSGFVHEVVQPVSEERMAFKDYLPALGRVLRTDGHFRRVTAARLVGGMANMALPFYIIFATDRLGFAADNVGLFVSAQVLGGLLAGTVLGYLSERSGSKAVILAALTIQLAAPLLALGVFATGGTLGALGPWVYALVFVAVGVGQSSGILGFINYVLELAPPQERVTYVGLTNTLSGVLALAPLIGAALVDAVSYTGMFIVVVAVLAVSLMLTVPIVEPRRLAAHPRAAAD